MSSEAQEMEEKRRRSAFHQNNLQGVQQDEGEAAEILRYLAEIDDLPIDQSDPVMGPLISKLTSTANLTSEQVKSNEWVFEYILILYLSKHPPKYGQWGDERALSHDSKDEDRHYLTSDQRMQIESFIQMGKLGLTRSEDFKAVEETTRNVSESVVHEENGSGGKRGIRGYLGL